jgi:1-phosphatidylinositol-3-phosphate 5-kinase
MLNFRKGQQRALTLVPPHSKVVLQEAIKTDSDFLARSNIMDYSYVETLLGVVLLTIFYSLLLGIDEERKQVACGLVDTIGEHPRPEADEAALICLIGSYTFAKTLEYKAKQNLSSGKEVTVIPPNEYQERFVNAMDSYFVACPGTYITRLDLTSCLFYMHRQMVETLR